MVLYILYKSRVQLYCIYDGRVGTFSHRSALCAFAVYTLQLRNPIIAIFASARAPRRGSATRHEWSRSLRRPWRLTANRTDNTIRRRETRIRERHAHRTRELCVKRRHHRPVALRDELNGDTRTATLGSTTTAVRAQHHRFAGTFLHGPSFTCSSPPPSPPSPSPSRSASPTSASGWR